MKAAPAIALSAAPPSTRPVIDRQHAPWIPLYLEFFRRSEDGYHLSVGASLLYALIIHNQGSPLDGRRMSKGEREKTDRPLTRKLSAGAIVRYYTLTYDQVQSWGEELEGPSPCRYCKRAHRLIKIDRPPGRPNSYRIIRCSDVPDAECVPAADALRQRRRKTGGARTARDGQPDLGLSQEQPHEPSDKLRGFGGGDGTPGSGVEKRVFALGAIAMLEEIDAPMEVLTAIAQRVETTDVTELRDALVRVVATASVQHVSLTPSFAESVLASIAAPGRDSDKVHVLRPARPAGAASGPSDFLRRFNDGSDAAKRTAEWARERLLELARRREPDTTPGQAAAYLKEVCAAIQRRFGDDALAEERELQRILTDPRVCGTIVKPKDNPIALMRDGLKNGWIWTAAETDDGSQRLARAFRALPPGAQVEVRKIFERVRRGELPELPYRLLSELGVTSRPMIAWLQATTE